MRAKAFQVPTVWRVAAVGLQLKLAKLRLVIERKYDPNQPRVPAGNPDGGRWTDAGSAASGSDGRFVVAQNMGRSGSRGRGGFGPLTPSQEMRLEVSQARADAAVARVRNIDPGWLPSSGFSATVEGRISHNIAIEREANDRYVIIRSGQVLFGPYTGGRAQGPGPFKRPTEAQRREVDALGAVFGCHTCGTRTPGTRSGRWIFDHQTPSAMGGPDAGRWGGPQCSACRAWSGGVITNILRYRR